MKRKSIIFVAIICFAFMLCGCSTNSYLISQKTNLDMATFFNEYYYKQIEGFYGKVNAPNYLTLETDKTLCMSYMQPINAIMAELRAGISAVDFFNKVNLEEEGQIKTKMYEYENVLSNELKANQVTSSKASKANSLSCYVLVVSEDNHGKFLTYVFYMEKSERVSIEVLEAKKSDADLSFVFSKSGATKEIIMTYGKNKEKTGCELKVSFVKEAGLIQVEVGTMLPQNSSTDLETYNFTIQANLYTNNLVGTRVLYNSSTIKEKTIYEHIDKDTSARIKLGKIKDEKNILAFNTLTENNIAEANISDASGYKFEYKNDIIKKETKTTCFVYGQK